MPQSVVTNVENSFIKGLITEATGLNFPENACTDTTNCVYTLIGDVTRREGINFESNFISNNLGSKVNQAITTYKWNNVGGDGSTQMVVVQNGGSVYFYNNSNSTVASPLSKQQAAYVLNLTQYAVTTFDPTAENQYADGNGYLFIYNGSCSPVYVSFASGVFASAPITVQIRDFNGIYEPGLNYNTRPASLTPDHQYNLFNQGWTQSGAWSASSHTGNFFGVPPGTFQAYDIGVSSLPISPGDVVNITTVGGASYYLQGTQGLRVTNYAGTTIQGNITATTFSPASPFLWSNWSIAPISTGNITTWHGAVNNYPSNSDIWWLYKDNTGVFNPSSTYQNVSISLGPAPKGHFIYDAFNQQKAAVSGVPGVAPLTTNSRPSTGAWFAGRVWYTGVNASQPATGDELFYSWTENIYFSQIVLDQTYFGLCYQANDPTTETTFDLLPTDGGIIQIQGSGAIYKLFPVQNGMLVFAANGVWFITGRQGIGFTADDYTITKISAVESLSSYSFVDVLGLPYFWNEEGIYRVQVTQTGSLSVEPLTVGTILTFYNSIPKQSKKYVRGAYDPINYIIQWLFKSTNEVSITDRYTYDSVLNFNTYNNAFYPYTIDTSNASINSITYVQGPGGSNSPDPVFKYLSSYTSSGVTLFSFAEESDSTFKDWTSAGTAIDYKSFFTTGYKIRGQGQRKFQPVYVNVYFRTNGAVSGYNFQGKWDYANSGNTGRWSSVEQVLRQNVAYDFAHKRHKLRGHGYAVQFNISSISGQPFDIIGWAVTDTINSGQ